MSNFNMLASIKNLDGSPIIIVDELATRAARIINAEAKEVKRPMNLGDVCINALLMPSKLIEDSSELDVAIAYMLAVTIYESVNHGDGQVGLELKEAAMLRQLIRHHYTTSVAGQAFTYLRVEGAKPLRLVD